MAAGTSRRFVRLYTKNGVTKHIFSVDGAIVSMAAHEQFLIVAYHMGPPSGTEQCLGFILFDVDNRKMLSKGRLPVSPGSELAWIGFSEDGLPATYDSKVCKEPKIGKRQLACEALADDQRI